MSKNPKNNKNNKNNEEDEDIPISKVNSKVINKDNKETKETNEKKEKVKTSSKTTSDYILIGRNGLLRNGTYIVIGGRSSERSADIYYNTIKDYYSIDDDKNNFTFKCYPVLNSKLILDNLVEYCDTFVPEQIIPKPKKKEEDNDDKKKDKKDKDKEQKEPVIKYNRISYRKSTIKLFDNDEIYVFFATSLTFLVSKLKYIIDTFGEGYIGRTRDIPEITYSKKDTKSNNKSTPNVNPKKPKSTKKNDADEDDENSDIENNNNVTEEDSEEEPDPKSEDNESESENESDKESEKEEEEEQSKDKGKKGNKGKK